MKTYKELTKSRILKVCEGTESFNKAKITSSLDAYNYFKHFFTDDIEIYESFFLLLLNRTKNTIGYAKISQGGVSGTVVDIKILLKYVVDTLADTFIICHNHPSGTLTPSDSDISLTRKLKDAANLLDTKLIDHIIISKDSFYSMADEGIL